MQVNLVKSKSQSLMFILLCVFSVTGISMDNGDKYYDRDPTVWLTKSSGTWRKENTYGFYRVNIHRIIDGSPHAQDTIKVDIIEAQESRQESGGVRVVEKIVKTITLDEPYKGYVRDVTFNSIDDNLIAISLDIEMKAMYGIRLRDIYVVSADGDVQKLVNASWVDI